MDILARRWQVNLALLIILILGLWVRSYNLDFPSIGYHNMAENESLCIAQEMKDSGLLSVKKIYFYNAFATDTAVKNDGRFPLVPYQILFSWRLFGENLWGARLFNISFSLLSILAIFLIAGLLFQDAVLSIFCAFLLSIAPLSVFFSRNLQPESPAFFFMLLGSLFYLRFCVSFKKYNLLLGGVFFSFSWAYQASFLFGLLPFIFCFPLEIPLKWSSKGKVKLLKYILSFLAPYFAILPFFLWLGHKYGWFALRFRLNPSAVLKLFEIFSPSYWTKYGSIILWYTVNENYTPVLSILALLGIILSFLRARRLLDRYIIGWALTLVLFAMVFSEQIYQQGFSQMPFLLLVCLACAYILSFVSEATKKNLLVYLVACVVLVSLPFAYSSVRKMHATVFLGEDVAGSSLKELTQPGERVFLFTHSQARGIARYAQRYMGWPLNLGDFKEKEDKFKVRYICIYPPEYLLILKRDSPDMYSYIEKNYHFKELGMMEEPDRLAYFILERGRGEDLEKFLNSIRGERKTKNIYQLFGRYIFLYTLRPAN